MLSFYACMSTLTSPKMAYFERGIERIMLSNCIRCCGNSNASPRAVFLAHEKGLRPNQGKYGIWILLVRTYGFQVCRSVCVKIPFLNSTGRAMNRLRPKIVFGWSSVYIEQPVAVLPAEKDLDGNSWRVFAIIYFVCFNFFHCLSVADSS